MVGRSVEMRRCEGEGGAARKGGGSMEMQRGRVGSPKSVLRPNKTEKIVGSRGKEEKGVSRSRLETRPVEGLPTPRFNPDSTTPVDVCVL